MYKKVVTIGGGGGHAAVVEALKGFEIDLTVLCNTVDDGGGSGTLMREYGVHSPGDFRRVMVTLAKNNAEGLNYRFASGVNQGQTLFNLTLAGLELSTGSFQKALDTLSEWLRIEHKIAPITEITPLLFAKSESGVEIVGQANVVKHVRGTNDPIATQWLEPKEVKLSDIARTALQNADVIIVSMGDLYSSIAPFFCIEEVQEIFKQTNAKIVWLPNVAVTPGHVHYASTSIALKFLQTLCPTFFPRSIIMHDGEVSEEIKQSLKEKNYSISNFDLEETDTLKIIREHLIDDEIPQRQNGDLIDRSPVLYKQEVLKNIFHQIL